MMTEFRTKNGNLIARVEGQYVPGSRRIEITTIDDDGGPVTGTYMVQDVVDRLSYTDLGDRIRDTKSMALVRVVTVFEY